MENPIPTLNEILEAHERIKPHIKRTPVMTCSSIDLMLGAKFFFKCENFQKVGAFKFRGACNAVFSLTENEINSGVATHSSGNHAAALALAARMRGARSYIVMPRNSPEIKKKAVAGYGAEITFCEPTLEARENTLKEVQEKTGATFIHPYDDPMIIRGQATAAVELLEEVGDLDVVMVPVGGGGLLSGTACATKAKSRGTMVIAGEPDGANDAFRSFNKGKLIPSVNPQTIADGLLTSLSDRTFHIIRNRVDQIVTAREDSIVTAMRTVWERMKLIIEPSAAVPLAAVLEEKFDYKNKRIGIIFSGGNVDLDHLPF